MFILALFSCLPTEKDSSEPVETAAPDDTALDPESRCTRTESLVQCEHQTVTLEVGGLSRRLHYQLPLGKAPDAGWPVVFFWQGSLVSAAKAWDGTPGESFGGWYEAQLLADLLDAGFAVLAPEAQQSGSTWWDTNIYPYSSAWESSPDHDLVLVLLAGVAAGTWGPMDPENQFATGISSGGYMSSRMALSYPGEFRALAIESAGWATCGSAGCLMPSALPEAHPPTLLLHGLLDTIVPAWQATLYRDALQEARIEYHFSLDPDEGHAWIPTAPAEVTAWFQANLFFH